MTRSVYHYGGGFVLVHGSRHCDAIRVPLRREPRPRTAELGRVSGRGQLFGRRGHGDDLVDAAGGTEDVELAVGVLPERRDRAAGLEEPVRHADAEAGVLHLTV